MEAENCLDKLQTVLIKIYFKRYSDEYHTNRPRHVRNQCQGIPIGHYWACLSVANFCTLLVIAFGRGETVRMRPV